MDGSALPELLDLHDTVITTMKSVGASVAHAIAAIDRVERMLKCSPVESHRVAARLADWDGIREELRNANAIAGTPAAELMERGNQDRYREGWDDAVTAMKAAAPPVQRALRAV